MAIYGKRLTLDNFALAAIAVCFIISTYFVGFPEGDNYASRGYLIPILVLGQFAQDFAGNSAKSLDRMCLVLVSFGLVHEGCSTFNMQSILPARLSGPVWLVNHGHESDLNTSTVSSSVFSNAFKDNPDLIYSVEKFVDGGKSHLVVADRQLECLGPHGPWQWQQSQPDIGK